MGAFRLALVNPNTDPADTDEMAVIVRAAFAGDVNLELQALTATTGSSAIETASEEVVAAAETIEMIRRTGDADAYLIGCFNDPGIDAARELTEAPIVGIGEAAYRAILFVARRFAVITTLPRGVPDLEEHMERLGVRNRCVGVWATGVPVSDQGAAFPGTTEAIIAAGRRAVEERGAEGLVLACGGMSDVETTVTQRVGVPATNGVVIGALFAHSLWRAGLRTSAAGSLAPLEENASTC
jgi:allantoin racemase